MIAVEEILSDGGLVELAAVELAAVAELLLLESTSPI
jgi:hypothetical protein